jgi:hypothetical protein
VLLGVGIFVSSCAAAPDYEPPAAVSQYDYPAYGSLDFDYWGGARDWHHHWDHDHWDDDHWNHEHDGHGH